MVMGVRPGAADDSVALAGQASVAVPHELPGQDPEGGSEVNFSIDDDSSSAAATPRGDLSRGGSDAAFNERTSMDSQPRSPTSQVGRAGRLAAL